MAAGNVVTFPAGPAAYGPAKDRPGFRRPRFLIEETPKRAFMKRLTALEQERSGFLAEWREISEYIHPRRGRYLGERRQDPRRSTKIINNAPTMASRTLASGMMSGISSPARPWFKLGTADARLNEFGPVKVWLKKVQDLMTLVFSKSNFYNSLHMIYRDLGDFGNASGVIDQDFEDVIRYTVFAPGEYLWASSGRNVIDTVYREHVMTVLQCIEKFGERCSQRIIQQYDVGNYDSDVDIVSVIEPNMNRNPRGIGPEKAPFHYICFEKSGDEELKLPLALYPYYQWPAPSPRWDLQAGDVYGSGCGIMALGDAKALQLLEKRKAQAIDKIVTPPMVAPQAMKNNPATHLPGGVTYYDGTGGAGKPGFAPAYQLDAGVVTVLNESGKENIARVNEAYFKDLFLMLAMSDRREITAREVEERHEEKLLALGPVLERVHNELLNPAVDRAYGIIKDVGILPEPPEDLHGQELQVEYISILAQAQRAVAVGAMERVAGFVGQLGAVFPESTDKFDPDQCIDEYASAIGVVPSIIRADEQVEELRKARRQAQEDASNLQATQTVAESAKVLSEAKTGDPNLLSQILTGSGLA